MADPGDADRGSVTSSLAQLPRHTWTVLQALRWPRRTFPNVDHVVVGPAGVFVIDSRTRDDASGAPLERAAAEVAEAALELATTLRAVGPDHVRPVLCFVGGEPATGWLRDVLVCSDDNVAHMLTTRPAVLTPQQVIQLCLDLSGVVLPPGKRKGGRAATWAAADPWAVPDPAAEIELTDG